MTVTTLTFLLAGIILIGFIARVTFAKTRIPTPVILMAMGMILGPLLHLVERDTLIPVAPYFGTVALLLILFEGGLELDFEHVLQQMRSAAILGSVCFVLTAAATTGIAVAVFHCSLPIAAFLGCIVGGTSPAVILPTLQRVQCSTELRTALALETTVSEVLTVVASVVALDYAASGSVVNVAWASPHLLYGVVTALIVGTASGLVWIPIMAKYGKEPLSYMVTLAIVFLLYASSEAIHSHGVVTVLQFGLVLANTEWIKAHVLPFLNTWTSMRTASVPIDVDGSLSRMNSELSFLVRTFFFVYVGMIVDFTSFDTITVIGGVSIVVGMAVMRWLSVRLVMRGRAMVQGRELLVISLLPRGLASIVMVLTAAAANIPGLAAMTQLVFLVVLLSNLGMTGFLIADASGRSNREPVPSST